MVRKDEHWVGASHKEVPPVFEASDDGQEFSVVDVIVSFGGVKCLGVVSYRSFSLCSFVFLVQYCSGGERGGVNFKGELFQGVGSVEDGVVQGYVNQFVHGLGVRIRPQEVGSLLQEVSEWSGDVGEAWDKGSLVSEDSQGRSHLFEGP